MSSQYICLYNQNDERWKVFEYVQGRTAYAPNYGTPLVDGETIRETLKYAEICFGISEDDIMFYDEEVLVEW